MKPHFEWMWIWWVPTVLICAWKLVEGIVRPVRMLEWPYLACAMWAYFYGYMAYQAQRNLSAYLGNGMSNIGQLMALLCLIGLLAGWAVGKRVQVRRSLETKTYPYGIAWAAGFVFLVIGAVGGHSVAEAIDDRTINYQATSAYWYLLFYVGYPGMGITIWALLKMKSLVRIPLWGITILGIMAFMLPHLIHARRGPLFPAIILLLIVPSLTLRRPPNRLIYCGGLIAAGVAMLVFLQVRSVTYAGGTWGEALQNITVDSTLSQHVDAAEDNEYINNCQTVATIYANGKYQYGTGHLEMFVHWVPHSIWKGKPTIGEGTYSFDQMWDDIEAYTGVRLFGHGAAYTGVADSFIQYGIFCPLFWFGLSYMMGVVYAKVLHTRNPVWIFVYTGFLCAAHWLISQNFTAGFVPAMYFELVPLGIFGGLWLYQRVMAPPDKFRPRRLPITLPQAATLS